MTSYAISSVVPCAGHDPVPASSEKGSANDQFNDLSVGKLASLIFILIFLSAIAVTLVGGSSMIAAFSIHTVAYIVIEFVCRAEGRAVLA